MALSMRPVADHRLPSALLTGLLVVLVWPSRRAPGLRAAPLDALAWALVLAAILTVAAEAFGLVASWYAQSTRVL